MAKIYENSNKSGLNTEITGEFYKELFNNSNVEVKDVAFSSNNVAISYSSSNGDFLLIKDINTYETIKKVEVLNSIIIKYSHNEEYIAVGGYGGSDEYGKGKIEVLSTNNYELVTEKSMGYASQVKQPIGGLCFSEDNKYIVSGTEGRVSKWNIKTKEVEWTYEGFSNYTEGIKNLEISFKNKQVAVGEKGYSRVLILNLDDGTEKFSLSTKNTIEDFNYSPNGNKIVVVQKSEYNRTGGVIEIFDANNGDLINRKVWPDNHRDYEEKYNSSYPPIVGNFKHVEYSKNGNFIFASFTGHSNTKSFSAQFTHIYDNKLNLLYEEKNINFFGFDNTGKYITHIYSTDDDENNSIDILKSGVFELYHLFNDNGDIKTYNNGWNTLCQKGNETESDFLDNGIENIDTTTLSDLNSSNPQLLTWTDDLENTRQTKLSAIPNDQLIIPNSDIDLLDVSNIDDITLNANISGNGNIKMVASKDGGNTWQVVSGGGSGDLIPNMTSNTSPEGEASASSSYRKPDYSAFKAFDDSISGSTSDSWITNSTKTGWLQYKFTDKKQINKYTITTRNNSNYDAPTDWHFKGSNDGENWDILDTVNNETGWQQYSTREYEFTNKNEYLYYRLEITNSSDPNTKDWVCINNLAMIKVSEPTINDILLNKTDISTDGITLTEFNNITSETWNNYIGDSNTLRFAYYLDIENETDVAETDLLEMQVDLQGDWSNAIHMTDYDYEYTDNNTITVDLMTDGSYKINYQK